MNWAAAHMGGCHVPTGEGQDCGRQEGQGVKITPGEGSSGQNFLQGSPPKTNLNETDYHFPTGDTAK